MVERGRPGRVVTLAGRVLAKLGAKYGYEQIGRARLTNDALIAMSAVRAGIVV